MTEHKFTFAEVPERAHSATWGKRRRQTRTLKGYRVSIDGLELGEVYERLTTFEQRTPGRRWVNSRWESPRWYYENAGHEGRPRTSGGFRSRGCHYETRQQAAESMYTDHRLVQAQKEAAE